VGLLPASRTCGFDHLKVPSAPLAGTGRPRRFVERRFFHGWAQQGAASIATRAPPCADVVTNAATGTGGEARTYVGGKVAFSPLLRLVGRPINGHDRVIAVSRVSSFEPVNVADSAGAVAHATPAGVAAVAVGAAVAVAPRGDRGE
jgi:hypothetical protein